MGVLVLVLFFLIVFEGQAQAYIDPATGSMLFSVFLGVATTLFFLLQTLYYKIGIMFTSGKLKKNTTPIVIYSEGKKYRDVFEDITDEFEKRKIPVSFLTSSEDDYVFSKNYEYVKPEFIGAGNKAFFKLAFLKADVCLMTTPGLDVFQLKRSKFVKHYSFLPHGIGDMCGYRLFSLDYFDSLLITSEINEKYIREIEQKRNLKPKEVVTVGSTQLDSMKKRVGKYSKNDDFTILFAPSWGKNSIARQLGEQLLDKLTDANCKVVIRFHPQSFIVEKDMVKRFHKKYDNIQNFSFDEDIDNMKSMAASDVMISDFSGIIQEYSFLFEKPVIYSTFGYNREIYDCCMLDEDTWRFKCLNSIGVEITKENVKDIAEIIESLKNSSKKNEINALKSQVWQKQGQGAVNVVDFLIQKQKEVEDK